MQLMLNSDYEEYFRYNRARIVVRNTTTDMGKSWTNMTQVILFKYEIFLDNRKVNTYFILYSITDLLS